MFDFRFFPVFNIADVMINVGLFILIVAFLLLNAPACPEPSRGTGRLYRRGKGTRNMHPLLFSIGPLKVYSWGFMVAVAFVVGVMVAVMRAKKEGISTETTLDICVTL